MQRDMFSGIRAARENEYTVWDRRAAGLFETGGSQAVEKCFATKSCTKGGKGVYPLEAGMGSLWSILRLYIAFRKRKAARTQAFLRVSAPF